VSGYLGAGSALEAARDFAQFAAFAMDAERSVLLQPIKLRLVESIVDISRILLNGSHASSPGSLCIDDFGYPDSGPDRGPVGGVHVGENCQESRT